MNKSMIAVLIASTMMFTAAANAECNFDKEIAEAKKTLELPGSNFKIFEMQMAQIRLRAEICNEAPSKVVPAKYPNVTPAYNSDVAVNGAVQGAVALKRMMHDPAKFELITAIAVSNNVACYNYRAANGFGAIRVSNAIKFNGLMLTKQSDFFVDLWNKECTKGGTTVTAISKWSM